MSPASPRALPLLLTLLLACGPAGTDPGGGAGAGSAKVPPELAAGVAAGKATRALVLLDRARLGTAPGEVELLLGAEAATDRVVRYAGAKQDLFAAAPAGLELLADYEHLPLALVQLGSPEALAHLEGDARVARLAPDTLNTTSLSQSLPLISQLAAAADGKDGTGTSVAVLDTGADWRTPDLGSCTAVGVPASCRVAFARDFAVEDGLLDDSVRHGTNTASIVAGVAPGAKILALDVFDGQGASTSTIVNAINWVIANRAAYHIAAMNLSLGGGSYTAVCDQDPMAVALAEARQVGVLAAVATGNAGTANAVSSPACAPAAVSVGAVYDANLGAIGFSACREAATAADQVTCFSNSASFQTLLAPGALITAGAVTMAGTSQAAPHVAGALAVLRGAFPAETPTELVTRLTSTGRRVTDSRTGRVLPRLDLAAAAAGCVLRLGPATATAPAAGGAVTLALTASSGCAWTAVSDAGWLTFSGPSSGTGPATLTLAAGFNGGAVRTGTVTVSAAGGPSATAAVSQGVDTTPPTGTVTINGGAPWTRTAAVALALTASDPSGVAGMCVTNGTTCSTFEPFATARAWTLAATSGPQTVRVFFKDGRGNVSTTAATAAIGLDTGLPTSGLATAVQGNGQVSLGWGAGSDAVSGLAGYRVVFATGATAPASCAEGTTAYQGTALATVHAGLLNGTSYAYRVCALDKAGNLSAGSVVTASPRPESDGPVAALAINGGAAATSSTAVTLAVTATDASAVTQACYSTTTSCTAWEPYTPTRAYTLSPTQGRLTVYVRLKDVWGNASAAPASASILHDSAAPIGGSLAAAAGNGSVTLTWSGVSDATSGVAAYRVVHATGTAAPASCATGTLDGTPAASPFTVTGLANGTGYAFRVCAVDRAGNAATGLTATAAPRPEADGPVGRVVINGGAAATSSPTVSLTLGATDASRVASMCLSSTTTCTAWEAFATSRTFTLPNAQGSRPVYATFRDEWGNPSATVSAAIVLDSAAPTGGTLTAAAGDARVTLAWSGVTDVTTGVAGYRVAYAAGATAPASCAAGTLAGTPTTSPFTVAGLTNGTAYAFRVCAVDRAGNAAAGLTAGASPRPESAGPVGTLTLNGGAAWTRSTSVTASLTATDASPVTQMCLGTSATACTVWVAFAPTATVTVSGTQTVYAWFKDVWGNVSAAPASARIALDATPPAQPALTATAGSQQVSLAWAASSDAGSGLAGYRLVVLPGTTAPAAACTSGTVLATGGTSFLHRGLAPGAASTYRLCAVDVAGNVSAGATAVARPLP